MGEEEKKTEETKTEEEETKAEEKPEETKDEAAAAPPPPPAEIVLKVFMHCEGCARKVRRCLKNFPGVEGVTTNCKTHEVVVKGEKADPVKVVERIQTKSRRKVELVSPIPSPPEEEKVAEEEEKPAPPPPEEEKKEEPQIVTVALKVHMHCEACAEEIKKRILKMKGVESVETDLEKSEVTVKGVYDPAMLVQYVHKRFGKQAMIVNEEKVEEEAKAEEEKVEEEAKAEEEKKEEKSEQVEEEKKEEGESEAKTLEGAIVVQETKVEEEIKKNEYYYNPPMDLYAQPPIGYHAYPPIAYPAYPPYYQAYIPPAPQIFSDENPNACSVM